MPDGKPDTTGCRWHEDKTPKCQVFACDKAYLLARYANNAADYPECPAEAYDNYAKSGKRYCVTIQGNRVVAGFPAGMETNAKGRSDKGKPGGYACAYEEMRVAALLDGVKLDIRTASA